MTIKEIRHKKFAREVVKNGGNAPMAYRKVYPAVTKHSAETAGSRMLKRDDVKKEIASYQQEILALNGPLSIARDLRKLRNAKKGIFYEGQRTDSEPDHTTRLAAVRTVLQTQNALSETPSQIQLNKIDFNITLVKSNE